MDDKIKAALLVCKKETKFNVKGQALLFVRTNHHPTRVIRLGCKNKARNGKQWCGGQLTLQLQGTSPVGSQQTLLT